MVLMGAGVLVLKPRDFLLLARIGGRVVGTTVRSLRNAKEAAEEVMAENEWHNQDSNSDFNNIRRALQQSLSKINSLTLAVRKDIGDVPLNPQMLLRKGMNSLTDIAADNQEVTTAPRQPLTTPDSEQSVNKHNSYKLPNYPPDFARKSIVHDSNTSISTGADFITHAIEEAALGLQQKTMFGTSSQVDKQRE